MNRPSGSASAIRRWDNMKTTVERSVERRRWERTDLVVRVDYKTVDELFSEFARNINEGGLFVETENPPSLGASVALQFQIPGSDEPIQVMVASCASSTPATAKAPEWGSSSRTSMPSLGS